MLLLLFAKKWHNIIYTFWEDLLPHTIWGTTLSGPLPHEFVQSSRRVRKLQISEIGKLTTNGIMFILRFRKTFVKKL